MKEQKDEETAGTDSPVSASSQTPDQGRLWERRWTDASKVNSHNLQVNTVTYYTLKQMCNTQTHLTKSIKHGKFMGRRGRDSTVYVLLMHVGSTE